MPSRTISSERPRVLIVDDNQAMLSRAAAALTPDCVVVGAAKDGRAAIELARALRPDVVVLDISMPGMSGLEVARALQGTGSPAAVVFLSVHDEEEFKQAARAAGGAGYVVKPRLGSDLMRAVRDAYGGTGAQRGGSCLQMP